MWLVLFLIFVVCALLYIYLTWDFNYWKIRGVDGPKPLPYFGTYPLSASFLKNLLYETDDLYRKYRDKTSFVGVFIHRTPHLLVLDPKIIKDILVTDFKSFYINEDVSMVDIEIDPLYYRNPFAMQGSEWKEKRGEITPALTMSKIRPMFPIIAETCSKMIEYIDNHLQISTNGIDAKDISSRFTADVICGCVFGLESKAFSNTSEFLTGSKDCFKTSAIDFPHKVLMTVFPFLNKIYPYKLFSKKHTAWFIDLTGYAIKARKANNVQRDDSLDFLIKLQEKKNLDIVDVAAHAFTIFLDGFDTTSTVLAHALYYLAMNEESQDKLRNELNKCEEMNFDDLDELPYLENVLNETLRLTPNPFLLFKTCGENVTITNVDGKTLSLEYGTKLQIPTHSIHLDPKYYIDPLKFDPDRFDEQNGGSKRYKDQGIFIPFGNGPRICIGMRLGIVQIKAAVFTIIKNYHLTTDAPNGVKVKDNHLLFLRMNKINLFFRKTG